MRVVQFVVQLCCAYFDEFMSSKTHLVATSFSCLCLFSKFATFRAGEVELGIPLKYGPSCRAFASALQLIYIHIG